MRWVAHAAPGEDLAAAAERAIDEVRRDLDGAAPDLVLAFATPGFDDEVARRLAAAFPLATVVGCAAGGVIGGARELESQTSVSLTAAVLPSRPPRVQAFGAELGRQLEARHLRASLAPDGVDPVAIIALLDPKAGDPTSLLKSLDAAFPDAVVTGGLASGATDGPCLLVDGRVSGAGGILVGISGAIRAQSVVAQGCRAIGQPMLVTRVEGQLVFELGQQRPVEVMRKLHDTLDERDRELFAHSLFLGIEMKDQLEYAQGDFLVRNVLGIEPKTGALAVAAEIEPWKAVQFHLRDAETSSQELETLIERAAPKAAGAQVALLFSCLGRGEGLYGTADHDTRAIRERFEHIPVGGFFCNGEIGRVADQTYLHGYTSSIVFLSEG